jgi:hypothetical protein
MNNLVADCINGFTDEIKQLFLGDPATIIWDTQFDITKTIPSYTFPLVIIKLSNATTFNQMIGGAFKMQAIWEVHVYNYEPNADLSDDSGFSVNLYKNIDTIKNHFSLKNWISQKFIGITTNYGFKLIMNGMPEAVKLQNESGMVPGYMIHFESTAFDTGTSSGQTQSHASGEILNNGIDLIEIDLTNVNIVDAGGSAPFNITSNTNWTITSDSLWLTVDVNSGNGNQTINLTVIVNVGNQRTGILTISGNDSLDQIITVVQAKGN